MRRAGNESIVPAVWKEKFYEGVHGHKQHLVEWFACNILFPTNILLNEAKDFYV